MSRPANPGTRAVLNARARKREIAAERAQLGDKVSALDAEEQEIDSFLAQCERYATKTPADQLQSQAVGSAEQGDGSPSRGDGTPPPIASPCSAEEQDAPRPLTSGEPSLGATATGEAPHAGTGSRMPSRHEGPFTEGPGIDSGASGAPARPDSYPEIPEQLRRPPPARAGLEDVNPIHQGSTRWHARRHRNPPSRPRKTAAT